MGSQPSSSKEENRDIRLCVDFRNLNKSFEKDNYPVPPMEQILQKVSGSEILSLLDGFSGYNQILVSPDDQLKTDFRTPWGTYAYRKMPFGLINVGATFERAIDIAFRGLINHSIVVYWMTLLYILNMDLIILIILEKYLNNVENLEYR